MVSGTDEDVAPETARGGPAQVVTALAIRKAEAVRSRLAPSAAPAPAAWVLGADTEVEVGGVLLGKPLTGTEARGMIARLSGVTHRVHTGIALIPGLDAASEALAVVTSVTFSRLSEAEIDWYVSTGEWDGAAGAYRIQERGAFLVRSIEGSYSNVVGLPLEAFYGMLMSHHYYFGGH